MFFPSTRIFNTGHRCALSVDRSNLLKMTPSCIDFRKKFLKTSVSGEGISIRPSTSSTVRNSRWSAVRRKGLILRCRLESLPLDLAPPSEPLPLEYMSSLYSSDTWELSLFRSNLRMPCTHAPPGRPIKHYSTQAVINRATAAVATI